jgi:hypothetical protein
MSAMKRYILVALVAAAISAGVTLLASVPRTYQVTGSVLAVDNDTITLQIGSDRWQIAKDALTKTTGDVKAGTTVTVSYHMTADTITAKTKGGGGKD